jgi:hypothetical protein
MDEMIAFCGLSCLTCPIHIVSGEIDTIKQIELITGILRECKEHYGIEYNIEDISDCDGCKSSTGKIFTGCLKCSVRICAAKRQVENCGYCNDYICEKLNELFKIVPEAHKRLETIRKNPGLNQILQ